MFTVFPYPFACLSPPQHFAHRRRTKVQGPVHWGKAAPKACDLHHEAAFVSAETSSYPFFKLRALFDNVQRLSVLHFISLTKLHRRIEMF